MPVLGLVAQGVDEHFIPSANLAVITLVYCYLCSLLSVIDHRRKQLTAPEAVVITKKFSECIAAAKQNQQTEFVYSCLMWFFLLL